MKSEGISPEYITLDIANAYSVKAEKMIKFVKDNFSSFLIAGNYATEEAVLSIEDWGADATKAGISNGHVCETYMATGFSRPQFSMVLKCSNVAKKQVISDGAVRNVGDIVKAIVAGSSMVMCGNLFSGYNESAGDIIEIDGKRYKQYFGSASYNNTLSQRNVEGKCILVDYKGEMEKLLIKIEDGIRSAISYSGGLNLASLKNVKWGIRDGGVRQ
jgi:GMP reductase